MRHSNSSIFKKNRKHRKLLRESKIIQNKKYHSEDKIDEFSREQSLKYGYTYDFCKKYIKDMKGKYSIHKVKPAKLDEDFAACRIIDLDDLEEENIDVEEFKDRIDY